MGRSTMEIICDELAARTRGLAGHQELLAKVKSGDLVPDARDFLSYVADYITASNSQIRDGQTISYGYWLAKFTDVGDYLEAWEYNASATEFVPGVTQAVTYWREQHEMCARFKTTFQPPRPDRLVVISDGVLEGDTDIQGVRYPSPEHMSGWWLTTNRYNGDVKSLRKTHAYHVTAARPDLAPLVALPPGFRFDLSQYQDVWFDEKVAALLP
jgi:hypothetical protein